jgi:hypothetical protein
VIFDLGPTPVPPDPPLPPRHDAPAARYAAGSPRAPVQRQEATRPADAAATWPGDEPATAGTIVPAPTTADMTVPAPATTDAISPAPPAATGSAPSAAPAGPPASGAAGVPLEELARQLFGPLTARLKAELRLDRERAGLLTDLRQ